MESWLNVVQNHAEHIHTPWARFLVLKMAIHAGNTIRIRVVLVNQNKYEVYHKSWLGQPKAETRL